MSWLIVNPGTENAWEIPLQPGVISIGRNPENNVPLDHSSIAGEHCLLTVTDGGVIVKDLGSANGTFVNDAPVDETPLLAGQFLRLGDVVLQLKSGPAPAQVMPPVPTDSVPGTKFCKIHPKAAAHFHCPKCRRNFCDLCVWIRQGRTFCRTCGVECKPLTPARVSREAEPSFATLARGAFLYPLKGDNLILLGAGTVFYLLLGILVRFASIVGLPIALFGGVYFVTYLQDILRSSAMGEEKMPDWPDFDTVMTSLPQILGTVVVCFGPAIALKMLIPAANPWHGSIITISILAGCLYFPMSFTAVTMLDSLAALNPLLVIPSILKIPLEYSLAVVFLAAVFVAGFMGNAFLLRFVPIPFLPEIISEFVGLYLFVLEMRILGLLYRAKRRELGWFER